MADHMNKDKAVQQAISQIERQFGRGSIMKLGAEAVLDLPAISTGALSLDLALGIGHLADSSVFGECVADDEQVFVRQFPLVNAEDLDFVDPLALRRGQGQRTERPGLGIRFRDNVEHVLLVRHLLPEDVDRAAVALDPLCRCII